MTFERGDVVQELHEAGDTDKSGTAVRFKADKDIFTETTSYDFNKLATRVRELAFLNRGLAISIEDQRGEEPNRLEYQYNGGIKSYVDYLNQSKNSSI